MRDSRCVEFLWTFYENGKTPTMALTTADSYRNTVPVLSGPWGLHRLVPDGHSGWKSSGRGEEMAKNSAEMSIRRSNKPI